MKIIYILGYERSGSTLIHNLVGQTVDCFAVGELRHIWQRNVDNRPCGCGAQFSDCDFWNSALGKDFKFQEHIKESRIFFPFYNFFNKKRIQNHLSYLFKLYSLTIKASNKTILVDCSKSVMHLRLLSKLKNVDLRVVHIIRDPRGIEYSMYKRKLRGEPRYKNHSTLLNILKIDLVNILSKRFMVTYAKKYATIYYENLVKDPANVISTLEEKLQVKLQTDFVKKNSTRIVATHSVAGSPSRHNTGEIQLKVDDSWQRKLSRTKEKMIKLFSYTYNSHYARKD